MEQVTLLDLEALRPLLAGRRFLLVHGPFYDSLGLSPFFDSLDAVHFTGFTPNPLYEQVEDGVRCFLENDCQAVVAVGGGSAMDVAKCVKLFCRMDPAVNYLQQDRQDTGVPLYAIPTTAGTGSEATRHAVIYYRGEKQSVSHPSIVPDAAVLLPRVLEGLPLYQKKCTLLDALCQAIESWWSRSATLESAEHSRLAIAGIRENWRAYIEQGDPQADPAGGQRGGQGHQYYSHHRAPRHELQAHVPLSSAPRPCRGSVHGPGVALYPGSRRGGPTSARGAGGA